jgi:hypothetical protein
VLRVSEVYEDQLRVMVERPDGSQYTNFKKVYTSRESLVNKDYIVSVRPHEFNSSQDEKKLEGRFPEGTKFSMLVLDGNSFRSSEMIVIGSFDKYCSMFEMLDK